jgi:hypothetical protein
MNFLTNLLDITKEAESPRSFMFWSGLSAISAATRRNVWVNKKIYKLYPNTYTMLVAKSGLRKGFPVKIAQKLVEALDVTKVVSGRNSIQAIILELSRQWTLESGKVLNNAHAFIVNDELGSLLVEDPSAQTILTTLYDSFYHSNWTDTLKSDGRKVLKDICITMLSATNQVHLTEFLDSTSVTGGFIGRTLIIYEEKKSRINALIDDDEIIELNLSPLIDRLKVISTIKGQMVLESESKSKYKDWYIAYNEKMENSTSDDDTGTSERLHDHILKIATLLSLSERDDRIITPQHIEDSIDLCTTFTSSVKRITLGRGKSETSDKTRIVLEYLIAQPDFSCTRKQLLRARYGDIDAIDLDKVIDTMNQAGIIGMTNTSEGVRITIDEKYAKQFSVVNSGKRVIG